MPNLQGSALRTERKRLSERSIEITLGTLLLIVVVALLIGAIPNWPHSKNWGYGPSTGLSVVLLLVIVLVALGRV
ncbi:DUF3309 domain-containing protein [Tahibacter soli]|jgi:hypothetical protein|uniref:DUF3309 domain-containing protein n=1 Tax=Tahibacter soli TaxID=2983605 RepID=A0A9X3YQC3_9GAMM|nr:DUF3309 domain-containing protein [Tahibacter soli]MDC8015515.1 DUF3309 domain-containing protein [Tahibacter soli]